MTFIETPVKLQCQTTQMNAKELWAHLLAYRGIRLLTAQAAYSADVDPRSLSSKHTAKLWIDQVSRSLSTTTDTACLFTLIAQSKVRHQPGRV